VVQCPDDSAAWVFRHGMVLFFRRLDPEWSAKAASSLARLLSTPGPIRLRMVWASGGLCLWAFRVFCLPLARAFRLLFWMSSITVGHVLLDEAFWDSPIHLDPGLVAFFSRMVGFLEKNPWFFWSESLSRGNTVSCYTDASPWGGGWVTDQCAEGRPMSCWWAWATLAEGAGVLPLPSKCMFDLELVSFSHLLADPLVSRVMREPTNTRLHVSLDSKGLFHMLESRLPRSWLAATILSDLGDRERSGRFKLDQSWVRSENNPADIFFRAFQTSDWQESYQGQPEALTIWGGSSIPLPGGFLIHSHPLSMCSGI